MRKLILASLTISSAVAAQGAPAPRAGGPLAQRLAALLDEPPFNRATWGVHVLDDRGRVVFSRNGDRWFVPASNAKLIVTAAASVLLPPDHRLRTSLYVHGTLREGVLEGDLVLYGRGDATFSTRCYGLDTTAVGACDSATTRIGALADSVAARGVRRITGRVVGDGSAFEATMQHPQWGLFDAQWYYAAPVTALAFNDNSIDFRITAGATIDTPPEIVGSPAVAPWTLDNRARTGPPNSRSTIVNGFFRHPASWDYWAEGSAALGRRPWTESVSVPDPNLFAAYALVAALRARGIAVEGGAASTTDSLAFRAARCCSPLVEVTGRPLADIVFPILNSSQNLFAEMLLKVLGREAGGGGSWEAGLAVERRFLTDSVGIDSSAFSLDDGSGLSAANLVTPAAFARLLHYMAAHPRAGPFLAALPRSGRRGSLLRRFVGTPLEGRVVAKTGSIARVNSLSGYVERPGGGRLAFAVMANGHAIPERRMLERIDAIVVELGRGR
jgi:D-alanyl-D-alanine carboxypeptidase/D-alanyl-D-alanine-endopeptidase (penicillin-binding protein 4)